MWTIVLSILSTQRVGRRVIVYFTSSLRPSVIYVIYPSLRPERLNVYNGVLNHATRSSERQFFAYVYYGIKCFFWVKL